MTGVARTRIAGEPDGRMVAVGSPPGRRPCGAPMEESPGSTGIRCRLTTGEGDLRESATENKPPGWMAAKLAAAFTRARVKRCGKSAPRPWQQGWQGKPHREQDRIGAVGGVRENGRRGILALQPGLVA